MTQNNRLGAFFLGVFGIVVVLIILFVTRNNVSLVVTNFNECAQAGYPIMESYPRQCRSPDGKMFVENINMIPSTPTTSPSVNEEIPRSSSMIQVIAPLPNALVSSPLMVSGTALGNWYFEASFPLRVLDDNGNVLAQVPVQAQGDWMTTATVPFSTLVTFSTPTAPMGVLVFEKDNPSGLPENAAEFRLPIQFTSFSTSTP